MSMVHDRPTVADMRTMKARGQKISMLYVTHFKELIADIQAGIYPEPKHVVRIKVAEFEAFLAEIRDQT